jgi:3-oxoacyl-[acyl-carrier protein] reductase
MDLELRDRRFLVGGASRGLGNAVAHALVGEGARVVGVSRQPAAGERTARGIIPIAVDLSEPDGPTDAVTAAAAALGGLDGLVVIRLIREALPHLRQGRDPAIVVILSSSVREPIPNLVTSNVLRPGLSGLIKSLVTEIAPIRINGVAPGRFTTERVRSLDAARAAETGSSVADIQAQTEARIPLGRYGDPAELGRVVAFLLSTAASYLDGVILPIDGGMLRSLP